MNLNIKISITCLIINSENPSSTTNEIINTFSYYPFGMTMAGSYINNTSTPDTRYQYNSKEYTSDLGLNLLDYGARWYDACIGRFGTVDRYAAKYSNLSPYQYGLNNPIKFVDVNGDSIDIFNTSGQYVRTDDDGKKGFSGMFYQNSTTDECGNVSYCDGVSFNYNDPIEDRKSVKEDGFKIQLANPKDIQNMLLESRNGDITYPYKYVNKEGRSGGKMDFFVQNPDRIPANTLSIIKDRKGLAVSYNPKDYGNFMYGLAMRFLAIPLSHSKLGAHYNNMFNGRSDGSENWQPFDSRGDQRAIRNGYYFTIKSQHIVR